MPTLTSRWAVLALLFVARFSIPVQFQSIAAVAPFLNQDLGISYTEIGLLLGLFFLPGSFLSLPGGMLSSRLGSKAVMVACLGFMLAGALLSAVGGTFWLLFAARLMGGVGAVVLYMMVSKVVTDWFIGKELATAMAISAASFGLGVGVAMGTLGGLATLTSWRTALLATAGLTAFCLALVGVLYRDSPVTSTMEEKAPTRLWTLSVRELTLVVIAGTAQVGFVTGYIVFMSFAPAVLIERGLLVSEAGALVSLAALVAIGSVPLGGYLTDRTRKPNPFIVGGAMGTALTCFLLPLWGPALLWILLFGLVRGGCTGGIQSMPAEVLRPESRNTGFGIYFTVHYLGLALLPPVAGYLQDTTGGATASVMFAGVIWLTIPASLLIFRLLHRHWAPEGVVALRGRTTYPPEPR